jgi:hypothetical protein
MPASLKRLSENPVLHESALVKHVCATHAVDVAHVCGVISETPLTGEGEWTWTQRVNSARRDSAERVSAQKNLAILKSLRKYDATHPHENPLPLIGMVRKPTDAEVDLYNDS